jgi:hypothetical protein
VSLPLAPRGFAQDKPAAHPFKVQIAVTMPSEFTDLMRSDLARELRRLDTVQVVGEKHADHTLHIVGVRTSSGGFAVAVTLETKVDVTPVMYFSHDEKCFPTGKQQRDVAEFYDDVAVVDNLWVSTDNEIQSLATRITAAVDVSAVEHHRQFEQQLQDRLRKREAKWKPE